jgi:hypothetical protein
MRRSDMPTKFPIPFADNAGAGYINVIPEASQIGTNPGYASLETGFVPDNFIPVQSGGIPPRGQDMNGILLQTTQWSQWQNAGGPVTFDGAFATAIGGYPKGAILASTLIEGLFWISQLDNNPTNPDDDSTYWISVGSTVFTRIVTASGVFPISHGDGSIGLARTAALSTSSAVLPPDAAIGQVYSIDDLEGNFFAYNVTISAPGGMTINKVAGVVLDQDFSSNFFRYFGSNRWKWWVS